ncbi:helix-turn-helix domain-containing protein [Novosphingobium resinovorum]|jgi:DNA-binding HxlR family transcriptional regulator|uniref:winged helix-turn-helix transcriptional regulator n=1 Tax=Novosphingobium resinovorum TaxID=158500 RepID=UPI002ED386E8|nr:helix-turn-helix domain-containing protein [Novosphingobium resinovorum]
MMGPDADSAQDRPQERPEIVALAADMAAHGTDRDAPVRSVMGLLGDRWSTLVLLVLASGPCRHAALRRLLSELSSEGGVSQRVLTLKLRALERDGFVERTASCDVPPRVSYALSPLGQDLASKARGMIDWVNAHEAAIHASRAGFDAREAD